MEFRLSFFFSFIFLINNVYVLLNSSKRKNWREPSSHVSVSEYATIGATVDSHVQLRQWFR